MGSRPLILLDTHVWIWFNLAPERLPTEVAWLFAEPNADFGISAVTVWETVLAAQKGRIETVLSPGENVRAWLAANPLKVIPIDEEIAILARTLQLEHSGPADRFIAATAFRLNCQFATVDDHLRKLSWLKVIPTRY